MTSSELPVGRVVLEVPPRTEFISLVRLVVASAAEIGPDMAVERVEDLRVAVSEATTNAIEAHRESGSSERINVECVVSHDQVDVMIHDEGNGFDPDTIEPLPAPGSPERLHHESGLGVCLMRLLADESEISSSPAGTHVHLVVFSSKRASSD